MFGLPTLLLSVWLTPCTAATLEMQTAPYIIIEHRGIDARMPVPARLRPKLVVSWVYRGAGDGPAPWRIKFGPDGPFLEVFGDSLVDNEEGIMWDLQPGFERAVRASWRNARAGEVKP